MTDPIPDPRERILRAAAELLDRGGRDAVSTRAVSAAAGVQPPTIYRQFGDMQGLLQAVARETFAQYLAHKRTQEPSDDPLADLRAGWDRHVAFGLAHPAAYAVTYGDPGSARREGEAMLVAAMTRVAAAGRLRVPVDHAARVISAAAGGVTFALIATPTEERDPRLADTVREAAIAAITTSAPPEAEASNTSAVRRAAARAVALRAALEEAPDLLSAAERALLGEWLDRIAGAPSA